VLGAVVHGGATARTCGACIGSSSAAAGVAAGIAVLAADGASGHADAPLVAAALQLGAVGAADVQRVWAPRLASCRGENADERMEYGTVGAVVVVLSAADGDGDGAALGAVARGGGRAPTAALSAPLPVAADACTRTCQMPRASTVAAAFALSGLPLCCTPTSAHPQDVTWVSHGAQPRLGAAALAHTACRRPASSPMLAVPMHPSIALCVYVPPSKIMCAALGRRVAAPVQRPGTQRT
jgi:hypothetical protein